MSNSTESRNEPPGRYVEWIPVRERLPDQDGVYDTMVLPLLESEPHEQRQRYERQEHPAINGWQFAHTTHWRPI